MNSEIRNNVLNSLVIINYIEVSDSLHQDLQVHLDHNLFLKEKILPISIYSYKRIIFEPRPNYFAIAKFDLE